MELPERKKKWIIDALGEQKANYYFERVQCWAANHPKASFSPILAILKWHSEDLSSGKLKSLGLANSKPSGKTQSDADQLNAINYTYDEL